MTQFATPAGRLVQGGVTMQAQKDMETGKPLFNDDGTAMMGVFMALAFPKLVNVQPNPEFAAFWNLMKTEAATAWPSLFPQGAAGNCINPRFSWKYQDGDGVDHNGKSVADKPGFAGNHIVKFYSAYAVKCYNEGQFSPHQELQKPDDTIKRGDWIRVVGDMRGNNATGNQVPGISLYPSLVAWVGKDTVNGRISSGPDAATAFAAAPLGYVPAGVTSNPAEAGSAAVGGVPNVGVPNVGIPNVGTPNVGATPNISVPNVNVGAAVSLPATGVTLPSPTIVIPQPKWVVAPHWAAQGLTVESILAQGWTMEAAAAQGYVVKQ